MESSYWYQPSIGPLQVLGYRPSIGLLQVLGYRPSIGPYSKIGQKLSICIGLNFGAGVSRVIDAATIILQLLVLW